MKHEKRFWWSAAFNTVALVINVSALAFNVHRDSLAGVISASFCCGSMVMLLFIQWTREDLKEARAADRNERARHAWDNWTQADVAEELHPWDRGAN